MPILSVPGTKVTTAELDALHVMYTDTAQTVTGVKTFDVLPQSSVDPTSDNELTRRGWVLSQIATATGALDWQDSVLDKDLNTPPPGPAEGDRYIVASPGAGDWAGHDNEIAEWNGTEWVFTTPNEGFALEVEDENRIYVYVPPSWTTLGSIIDHGSLQGLGLDHHTQYILVDGTRAFTGNVDIGSHDITNINNLYMNAPSATSGKLYMGGTVFMRDYGGNIAIGNNAGNDTMTSAENILIGASAGLLITTGNENIFIGEKCGDGTSTGNYNIGIGAYAISGPVTGNDNTAIGTGCMYALSTGTQNTAVGSGAMAYVSGSYNTSIGFYSARNMAGSYNVAVGTHASFGVSSGESNVAVGRSALYSNTASYNVAVGSYAGSSLTGGYNVYVGSSSGRYNTSGTNNVGIGQNAGSGVSGGGCSYSYSVLVGAEIGTFLTTGSRNTCVGYSAGRSLTSGGYNVIIGYNSGYSVNTGGDNILIGAPGGYNITTGSGNIIIGRNSYAPSATGNYQLNIGNLIFGTDLDGTELNISTGNIGIATTSPNSRFQVIGAIATTYSLKSSAYTLTKDDSVVGCDASLGAFTITLPTAIGITGRMYTIKKTDNSANTVTIACSGGETIDGSATYSLSSQWQWVSVVSDGSNWLIVSEGS